MNLDEQKLPQHVAIIMDGNRRWAKARDLTAVDGHRYVVNEVIEPIVDRCIELGIPYLTLWAFSTENWDRDEQELNGLMDIFRLGLKKKAEALQKKGVRLQVLGEINRFPQDIASLSRKWMDVSKDNTKINVTFALNYGGRDEIQRSVNRVLEEKRQAIAMGEVPLETLQISQEEITSHLDTAGMPEPDLIIRPGGQLRLSGFMPWQAIYAELYFTDVLMPDFTVEEFDTALLDYAARQRRFGK